MNTPAISAPDAIEPARAMLESFLEDSHKQGTQFQLGETIQCMWMWFKVGGTEKFQEVLSPLLGTNPMHFQNDCSDALNLVLQQRYVCDSFEIEAAPCDASQSVITVRDIESCHDIFLNRSNADGHASGWFIGAEDSKCNAQNADDLELRSMWEISCLFPSATEFFLLPPDWQVILNKDPIVLKDYEPVKPISGSYFERKYR